MESGRPIPRDQYESLDSVAYVHKDTVRIWTRSVHISKRRLAIMQTENAAFPWADYEAPAVRGDCLPGGCNEERPCPWARCRWHLAHDYNRANGSLTENSPGVDFDELPETCALDVADRGETSLDELGRLLNVTREAMRLTEIRALAKLKAEPGVDAAILLELLGGS